MCLMVGAAEREPKVQEKLASLIQFVCYDVWWLLPALQVARPKCSQAYPFIDRLHILG
jgi:hypothetical protein